MSNQINFGILCNKMDKQCAARQSVVIEAENFQFNLVLSYFFCLLYIVSLAGILYVGHYWLTPVQQIQNIKSLFLDKFAAFITPKPHENFVFGLILLLLPMLVFLSIKSAMAAQQVLSIKKLNLLSSVAIFILTIPMIYCFISSDFVSHLMFILSNKNLTILLFTTLSLIVLFFLQRPSLINQKLKRYLFIIGGFIVISAILLPSMSFRLTSIYHVVKAASWINHFGAVFYTVTQVFAGKSLLIDLPGQYGMYSELLYPVFKVIGLSIFKFSSVMEFLQISALTMIAIMLVKSIRSGLLTFLCMLSLCLMTGFTWLFIKSVLIKAQVWEPYYQYYPIRFFFPALGSLLLTIWIKRKNYTLVLTLSVVTSIALIWNLESGIALLGAFWGYLCSFIVFPNKSITRIIAARMVLLSLVICSLFIMLFFVYLHLKSGKSVDFAQAYKFHKAFYTYGFYLISLPLSPSPWQVIASVYLLGLIGSLMSWLRGKRSNFWDFIFCLSALGVGLFLYFEARAHQTVLILACWPAIIILFAFADRNFRLVRLRILPRLTSAFCFPVLLFGLVCAAELMWTMPKLTRSARSNLNIFVNKKETEITRNLNFIKANIKNDKKVLILAPNQAVYYGELGLGSPVNGAGLIETVLKSDLTEMYNNILKNANIIFYQPDPDVFSMQDFTPILKSYRIIARSQENMLLLAKVVH